MENQNNISVNDELIVRYLAGEAGPEEAVALHDWLEQPANRHHYDGMSAAWHKTRPAEKHRIVNAEEAWSSIQSKMPGTPGRFKYLPFFFAVAASLTAFVIVALWTFHDRPVAEPNLIVLSTTDSSRQISLSDNSSVMLNRQTTFSYPEAFAGNQREVRLVSGEGFFNVSPNPDKPFVVETSLGKIRVIGTMFNVSAEDGHVRVGVKEGKVMVHTNRDSVLVLPGFTAELFEENKIIQMDSLTDVNDWGYATHEFVFYDTPISDVIAKIEKSFPCKIQTSDTSIRNCKLTATFENVSIEKMLSLMAETLSLSVTRHDEVFTLEGKGCP